METKNHSKKRGVIRKALLVGAKFEFKKMKKKLFIGILCCLFFANYSKAQLKFKNSQDHPIWVAIAYYENDDSFTGWFSRGWYEIEPGETKVLIGGDLEYSTYYFYAYDSKGAEWKGAGKYSFIVDHPNAFQIKNADKSYQLKGDREFKGFKKISTQGEKSHTLSLGESEEE